MSWCAKYRPKAFSEVIGQNAAIKTLTEAVNTGKIAPGYILHGPKGSGKTSTARLFARALNCIPNGPTSTPCTGALCSHCTMISAGSALDVMEIDAASNRGIDDTGRFVA